MTRKIVKNCRIIVLNRAKKKNIFVRGLYDKKQKKKPRLMVLFTSDVMSSSSSSSVGCRAGDYELPPATTIRCQFRQLARAIHVVCVSQKVLNVSEKQGSLPSWFSLPMWWNIQCVLLAWLIIRHHEYMTQKPQLAGSDIFY